MSEERLEDIKASFNIEVWELMQRTYGKTLISTHLQQEQELYNEVIRLRKQNEILKQNNVNEILRDDLILCTKQYKKSEEKLEKANKKIDKAIEYIEKHETFSYDENCNIIGGYEINDLLNILRGNDDSRRNV